MLACIGSYSLAVPWERIDTSGEVCMRRVREVLRLKLAAGLSAREIARRLVLAPSTVRATIEGLPRRD